LESASFSKDSFGDFEPFQGVMGGARPDIFISKYFARLAAQKCPSGLGGAPGSAEKLKFHLSRNSDCRKQKATSAEK
jgi:hypothetical protein